MNVELSKEEVEFITKAMIHSGNVHRHFCINGSADYSEKETNELIEEINRIIKKLRNENHITIESGQGQD